MMEGCAESRRGLVGLEDEAIELEVTVGRSICSWLGMEDISEVGE